MSSSKDTATAQTTVSVGTSATQILASKITRRSFEIAHNGAATVFLGPDNTVTTSNGTPLLAYATYSRPGYTGAVFGIVASGTQDVRVGEVP